jgi:hypothetical protein
MNPLPELVTLTQRVADLAVTSDDRDDLPGKQNGVDPFPEQTGVRGLDQQLGSVMFAEAIAPRCVTLPRRQLIE